MIKHHVLHASTHWHTINILTKDLQFPSSWHFLWWWQTNTNTSHRTSKHRTAATATQHRIRHDFAHFWRRCRCSTVVSEFMIYKKSYINLSNHQNSSFKFSEDVSNFKLIDVLWLYKTTTTIVLLSSVLAEIWLTTDSESLHMLSTNYCILFQLPIHF